MTTLVKAILVAMFVHRQQAGLRSLQRLAIAQNIVLQPYDLARKLPSDAVLISRRNARTS